VWNQGPGFSSEDRDRLFRRFSRLHSSATRDKRGTGVGLYSSWRIIQLHRGRIRARSEPGAWAEFSFELSQPLGLPGPAVSDGVPGGSGRR
jgi:signal transduction histidine kinase